MMLLRTSGHIRVHAHIHKMWYPERERNNRGSRRSRGYACGKCFYLRDSRNLRFIFWRLLCEGYSVGVFGSGSFGLGFAPFGVREFSWHCGRAFWHTWRPRRPPPDLLFQSFALCIDTGHSACRPDVMLYLLADAKPMAEQHCFSGQRPRYPVYPPVSGVGVYPA